MVFSDTIYSKLPFVSRIRNLEDLPKLIRKTLAEKFDFSILDDYLIYITKNTFEVDIFGLAADGRNRFYYGGSLKDTHEITTPAMEAYLKDNYSKFEKLALEHVKKIKQWKIHNERISKT